MARYPGRSRLARRPASTSAPPRGCARAGPRLWLGLLGRASRRCAGEPGWPVLFLLLPPAFYVLSLYSARHADLRAALLAVSYYNTRYGLAALPLLAFGGAARWWRRCPARFARPLRWLVVAVGRRRRGSATRGRSVDLLEGVAGQLGGAPRLDAAGRRLSAALPAGSAASSRASATRSGSSARPGFRCGRCCTRATARPGTAPLPGPDLFLHEEWALAIAGDPVDVGHATDAQAAARATTV